MGDEGSFMKNKYCPSNNMLQGVLHVLLDAVWTGTLLLQGNLQLQIESNLSLLFFKIGHVLF